MFIKIASIMTLALLAGCVVPTPTVVPQQQAFNAADLVWSKETGTGVVSGNAFLRTVGGDVKSCAGFPVSLAPHSPYSQERATILYGSDAGGYQPLNSLVRVPKVHPDFSSFYRRTTCDINGEFEFTNVPSGVWYLVAIVTWKTVSTGFGGAVTYHNQGGRIMRRVEVDDDRQEIVLTH